MDGYSLGVCAAVAGGDAWPTAYRIMCPAQNSNGGGWMHGGDPWDRGGVARVWARAGLLYIYHFIYSVTYRKFL